MLQGFYTLKEVAPRAGAWIETDVPQPAVSATHVAPHAGAWTETLRAQTLRLSKGSHFPKGA